MSGRNAFFSYVLLTLLVALFHQKASAFSTDTYANASVLSEGRWVKISVAHSGIHFIPAATLRSWGFSNPKTVGIYGYGGQRLPDRLSRQNYIDDLPRLQVMRSDEGIYFYGVGPEKWTRTSSGNYYHSLNPFSTLGYYFLTDTQDDTSDREIPLEGFDRMTEEPLTVFTEKIFHETDRISPGQTGHQLIGEDLRNVRSRTIDFNTPGHVEQSTAWLRASFVAASSGRSTVTCTANGVKLTQTAETSAVNAHIHATSAILSTPFEFSGTKLQLGISYATQGVASLAGIDGISLNYLRRLMLDGSSLHFAVNRAAVALAGASGKTTVWDVTDPLHIKEIRTLPFSDGLKWTNTYSGERSYAAWDKGAELPRPEYVGSIRNQNLHGITDTPEMVIISARDWIGEANRLARFHSSEAEPVETIVVNQDDIFNEFSSGTRDVNALRRFLKMMYDRGIEAGRPLRYVMLFGRATFDNRCLTPEMKTSDIPIIPSWQTDEGLSATTSFTTDDIIAMLDDDSGSNLAEGRLTVAVGRVPVRNLTEAKTFVDKVISYSTQSDDSAWKNRIVMIADNGDLGVFMKDSERQYANFLSCPSGSDMFYNKVYIDAFDVIGGECTGGRKRFQRLLDEGIMWLNYVGHGDRQILSEENVFTPHDIKHMSNRRWPILFAASCNFAMHDHHEPCGAEILLMTPKAGMIGCIAPVREAMISHNGIIAEAFGLKAFERDGQGRFMTIGDISRNAKNHILETYSSGVNHQKLYYALLGDPALRIATPSSRVVLEQINDREVSESSQCTVMARQRPVFSGAIYDRRGKLMEDFNGVLSLTLYDAEHSTTSNGATTGGGNPTEGARVTFEEQGEKLYTGRDSVRNGRFNVRIAMPAEVAGNFRPAALNMHAIATDGREASGCNRQFFVFGHDDSADTDSIAPSIEFAYLNHETFAPGTTVNENPVFIARVSDNIGINLSSAGIGHRMTIKMDGRQSFEDVTMYYSPAPDGSPAGMVAYPLGNLSEGNHSLTFRVWDTSGNSASKTLDFNVRNGATPKIFDIYTDTNPASTETNFYISHDRPDAILTVTIDVYDMLGRRVWTTTASDRSYIFSSAPINWNLTDMSGRRLPRGIYIYRATLKTEGSAPASAAKRIAITAL